MLAKPYGVGPHQVLCRISMGIVLRAQATGGVLFGGTRLRGEQPVLGMATREAAPNGVRWFMSVPSTCKDEIRRRKVLPTGHTRRVRFDDR